MLFRWFIESLSILVLKIQAVLDTDQGSICFYDAWPTYVAFSRDSVCWITVCCQILSGHWLAGGLPGSKGTLDRGRVAR